MAISPTKQFRRFVIDTARAAEPVTPPCPHAPPGDFCGGCALQNRSYADQVAAKIHALHAIWEDSADAQALAPLAVVPSPAPLGYRTRMDYVASKERFGLRRGGKFNYIIDLSQCLLLPTHAFGAARSTYERAIALGMPDYNLRSHAGYLRYIVVRRSPDDQLLLAAVTSAPEASAVLPAAMDALAQHALAQPGVLGFHWLVNDTRTDISFGALRQIWGAARLPMRAGRATLAIEANTFFQNNVALLEPLLAAIRTAVFAGGVVRPRVADLYGGVGTIALQIADAAESVLCVESVAESAALARENAAANGAANVAVRAEDVADALQTLPPASFDVVVSDPPRVGMGEVVCRELLRLAPQRIVYLSCNPPTQREDASILAEGYTLTQLVGYDMYPQTPHLEALAVFERRAG